MKIKLNIFQHIVFFLFFCFSTNFLCSQNPVIDSLIKVLNSAQIDSVKVKLYGDISWEFMSVDISKSQFYAEKELSLAKKINNEIFIAQAESDIGTIYNRKGNFQEALNHYYKAAELRQKLKHTIKLAGVYNNIATVLIRQNKFNDAIEINFKSLKIFEEAGDLSKQASILGNIGNIYNQLNQSSQALFYFRRGLNIAIESGDSGLHANSLSNMGAIKYSINELDSSLFFLYKAENILTKNKLMYNLGSVYNNIGKALASKNDNVNAIKYYQKSLENRIKFEDEYGMALSNLNIGSLYITNKNYVKAFDCLIKSEMVLKKKHAFNELKNCYVQLVNAAKLKGDLNSALNYYKLLNDYKDSIYTKESADQLLEMNAKYETEKKEQENILLNIQNKLSEKTIKQQRFFSYFIGIVSLLLASLAFLIFRGLKQQKKANLIISAQKKEVENKSLIIEEKHREITDSINYAERIQQAVLPDLTQIINTKYQNPNTKTQGGLELEIWRLELESFILFKPKDVVSGDFYWATKITGSPQSSVNNPQTADCQLPTVDFLIVTVADCTGHGVPGAFMSMLGISFLNEIVRKKEITQASQVLDNLRENVIEALKQSGEKGEQKDGMDMALVVINTETLEMQFAGANNPCWIVSGFKSEVLSFDNAEETNFKQETLNIKLHEVKPDKQPIGIHSNMQPFTNQIYQLQKGDCLYMMSDGFQDQFGGPNRKKFLAKNLKNLLIANSQQPIADQKQILETTLIDWIGTEEQIDDITVLGIRI